MSGLNRLMSSTNQGLLAQGVFQQSIILLINLSPVPSLRPGRVHVELRSVHHRAQLGQKPEHPCGLYVSLKFIDDEFDPSREEIIILDFFLLWNHCN